MQKNSSIELWGGLESTLNRIGDNYHDQLEYTGFYYRQDDLDKIAGLGITTLRYPVLWERQQPHKGMPIDWSFSERNLFRLQQLNVTPIVGLVHHGSGPRYVSLLDDSFANGLAAYAASVAEKFPWVEYYTPVNEPLTTARFCGLYGHWFPHRRDERSFYTILLSECKATVKAMQAIRQVNPGAKLVQTEDLGKTYSTPLLRYQADHDNQRRWLTFDLLCGRVDEQHPLWHHLTAVVGIPAADLYFFTENPCPPHSCGLNYYMTSERFLDEDWRKYPPPYHSGNGRHRFADLERIRVDIPEQCGIKSLLKEAYEHLQLPIAITECHLHCTRDEQMRWFSQIWQTAQDLKQGGVDIQAVTAWALLGTYGWDKLMVEPMGTYETGAFKVTDGTARPTAFAQLLQMLAGGKAFQHPVLPRRGWWQRHIRLFCDTDETSCLADKSLKPASHPLLVVGKEGVLSQGFRHVCFERNLPLVFIDSDELDSDDSNTIKALLQQHKPWAIVALTEHEKPATGNSEALLQTIAATSHLHNTPLLCFLPEPADKGKGSLLYAGNHQPNALCIYEATATLQEEQLLTANPEVLLIRTGSLFSPWNDAGVLSRAVQSLLREEPVKATTRCTSFAYVPDVVHIGIDWLLDGETGLHYMANSYQVSRIYLLAKVATLLGRTTDLLQIIDVKQPQHRNLQLLPHSRRIPLPYLDHAMQRFVATVRQQAEQEGAVM